MKKKWLLMAAVVALVSGCADHGGMPSPQLTFSNYAPMRLNVQSSTVSENYAMPNDAQDMSGQFVLSPAEAVKRYAATRFPASGNGNGKFEISIQDSRIHLRQIAQTNTVLKWSGVGQEDEYHLFLRVAVTPTPDGVSRGATTIIRMDRTLVMPSSVSVEDREMRQVQFLEKLIADLDASITKALDDTPSIKG